MGNRDSIGLCSWLGGDAMRSLPHRRFQAKDWLILCPVHREMSTNVSRTNESAKFSLAPDLRSAWFDAPERSSYSGALNPTLQSPPSPDTDAYRLFDGDNIQVDTFAGNWLVQTRDCAVPEWIVQQTIPRSIWHKRLDKEEKSPPTRLSGESITTPFAAREHGIQYEIDFQNGYSQGIFLDQRLNRLDVKKRIKPGHRLLNTFAYTCGFSVVAATAGAITTSVDLSRNYLEWGKRNFRLNEIELDDHFFTRGDTFDWLKRWKKSNVRFDGIILDPPTFSRNEKGKVFRVEKDYAELVALANNCSIRKAGFYVAPISDSFRMPSFDRWSKADLEPPQN